MPTLKLTGGKTAKPAATRSTRTPARKTAAAKRTPTRKAPAPRKPAAAKAAASTNGGERGLKLPEGMTQGQFNKLVKEMQKARSIKEDADAALKEAQEVVNTMAIDMLKEGVQMAVIHRELDLSRQWMYKLMDAEGLVPAQSRRNSRTTRRAKPAAAKKPAAKKTAARKAPARKRPQATARRGGGRVHFAR